jgi:hypothetical protein
MRRTIMFLAIAAWAATSAHAAGPVSIHFGAEFRKISAEECVRKAMAALAKEKLIRAQIDEDGGVSGVTEQTAVKVLALPFRDGVHILVFAGGADDKEAERLRNAVRTHILEGADAPDAPKQHQDADKSRKPYAGKLSVSLEQRNVLSTVRFFAQAATIVLEKNGMKTHQPGPGMVFGANEQGTACMVAVPGPNEVNVRIAAAVISEDAKEADRLQNVLRAGVVRVLFD